MKENMLPVHIMISKKKQKKQLVQEWIQGEEVKGFHGPLFWWSRMLTSFPSILSVKQKCIIPFSATTHPCSIKTSNWNLRVVFILRNALSNASSKADDVGQLT